MKRIVVLSLITAVSAIAFGTLWVDIYWPDEVTPYDGTPIMVGQRLVFVLSSDAPGQKFVFFRLIAQEDRDRGRFLCRDSDPDNLPTCDESKLPAAGNANATLWDGTDYEGAWMQSGSNAVPGEWLILDYFAEDSGPCLINLAEGFQFTTFDEIIIDQIPSRDFTKDGVINFDDFQVFAGYWQQICDDPNLCDAIDVDASGIVDSNDLTDFSCYWLMQFE